MTHEDLIKILRYEEDTGEFYWRDPHCRRLRDAPAGTWHPRGYRTVTVMQKRYLAHRLAWFYVNGEWPSQIDHINGIRTDNRIANLRTSTQSLNNANCRLRKDSTSGAKGVSFCKIKKLWLARIKPPGKARVSLGYFDNVADAALAYSNAAKEYFGEFARAA